MQHVKWLKLFIYSVNLLWLTLPPVFVHRHDQIARKIAYVNIVYAVLSHNGGADIRSCSENQTIQQTSQICEKSNVKIMILKIYFYLINLFRARFLPKSKILCPSPKLTLAQTLFSSLQDQAQPR